MILIQYTELNLYNQVSHITRSEKDKFSDFSVLKVEIAY